MVTPELLDFIRAQLADGMSQDELSALLLADGGWNMNDVEEAFRVVNPAPVAQTPLLPVIPAPVVAKPAPVEQVAVSPTVTVAQVAPSPVAPPVTVVAAPPVVVSPPATAPVVMAAPVQVAPQPERKQSSPLADLLMQEIAKAGGGGAQSPVVNTPAVVAPQVVVNPPIQIPITKVVASPELPVARQAPIVENAPEVIQPTPATLRIQEVTPIVPEITMPVVAPELPSIVSTPPLPTAPVLEIAPEVVASPPPQQISATPQSTEVQLPTIVPGEDFLGIFGDEAFVQPASTEMSTPTETVHTPTPVIQSSTAPTITPGIKSVDIRLNSPPPSVPTQPSFIPKGIAMPELEMFAKDDTNNSEESITPAGSEATIDISDADGGGVLSPKQNVTFNLHKVRGVTPDTPGGVVSEASAGGSATRASLAANLMKASPPQMGITHEHAITPPSSDVVAKASLFSKRTMASDILLRGMSGGEPSVKSAPPQPVAPPPTSKPTLASVLIPPQQSSASSQKPPASSVLKSTTPSAPIIADQNVANDVMKKNRVKRIMGVVIGALLVLGLLGGVGFALMQFVGLNANTVLASAMTNFFSATTFAYTADLKVNLAIGDAKRPEKAADKVEFAVSSGGSLRSDVLGYGDGNHHAALSGSFTSGNFSLPTEIETDITMLGSTLFFHIVSLPKNSDLDKKLFEKYWVKVDLAEIAKELSLSGVLASGGDYGSFAGSSKPESSFVNQMKTLEPFVAGDGMATPEEKKNGTEHISFSIDPDKGLEFILARHRMYFGKELVLSDDQRLRIKNAIEKIKGELWAKGDVLTRIRLQATLDDIIIDDTVEGSLSLDISFPSINEPVDVAEPAPILTLEELRVQMQKFTVTKQMRVQDEAMIDRLNQIASALRAYYEIAGRYPFLLTELYPANVLSTSTISENIIDEFSYVSYLDDSSYGKSNRCTPSGKTCGAYHLGVSLRSGDAGLVDKDMDFNSDVRGSDSRGCRGEADHACYDVISPKVNPVFVEPKVEIVEPATPPPPPPTPPKTPAKKK